MFTTNAAEKIQIWFRENFSKTDIPAAFDTMIATIQNSPQFTLKEAVALDVPLLQATPPDAVKIGRCSCSQGVLNVQWGLGQHFARVVYFLDLCDGRGFRRIGEDTHSPISVFQEIQEHHGLLRIKAQGYAADGAALGPESQILELQCREVFPAAPLVDTIGEWLTNFISTLEQIYPVLALSYKAIEELAKRLYPVIHIQPACHIGPSDAVKIGRAIWHPSNVLNVEWGMGQHFDSVDYFLDKNDGRGFRRIGNDNASPVSFWNEIHEFCGPVRVKMQGYRNNQASGPESRVLDIHIPFR
jgi:hypothetical protein